MIDIVHTQCLILMGRNIAESRDGFPWDRWLRPPAFLGQILHQLANIDDRHTDGPLKHLMLIVGLTGTIPHHGLGDS